MMNDHMQHQMMSDSMKKCIQACTDCHNVCTATLSHCLEMGGKHTEPRHLRLMMDCAQMCQTSNDFMLRMSEFHHNTCGLCADVCEQCAQSCAQMMDDPMMKHCAEVCAHCAETCRAMELEDISKDKNAQKMK